jgi:hypothetical protein
MIEDIPRGVWYEEPRRRWRVRLYVGTKVRYRSYHHGLPDAIKAYHAAVEKLKIVPDLKTNEGQIAALIGKLA